MKTISYKPPSAPRHATAIPLNSNDNLSGRLPGVLRKLRSASMSCSSVCRKRSAFVRKLSSPFQYLRLDRFPSATPFLVNVTTASFRALAVVIVAERRWTDSPVTTGARYRDDTTISGTADSSTWNGWWPHQQQHQHERRLVLDVGSVWVWFCGAIVRCLSCCHLDAFFGFVSVRLASFVRCTLGSISLKFWWMLTSDAPELVSLWKVMYRLAPRSRGIVTKVDSTCFASSMFLKCVYLYRYTFSYGSAILIEYRNS